MEKRTKSPAGFEPKTSLFQDVRSTAVLQPPPKTNYGYATIKTVARPLSCLRLFPGFLWNPEQSSWRCFRWEASWLFSRPSGPAPRWRHRLGSGCRSGQEGQRGVGLHPRQRGSARQWQAWRKNREVDEDGLLKNLWTIETVWPKGWKVLYFHPAVTGLKPVAYCCLSWTSRSTLKLNYKNAFADHWG